MRAVPALACIGPLIALAACSDGAGATVAGRKAPIISVLSGESGMPAACAEKRSEDFPQLAVDPRDPEHVSALYLQDGTRAAVGASSADGGVTWRRAPVAAATTCTGGTAAHDAAFNPQLAQGHDGRVYYGYTNFDTVVYAADDAAGVWNEGVSPGDNDDSQNIAVSADPASPANVHALWTHFDYSPDPLPAVPYHTELRAAASLDGARSFGPAQLAADSPAGRLIVNVRMARASDGAALACFDSVAAQDLTALVTDTRVPFEVECMRTRDGLAWTGRTPAGASVYLPLPDPEGRSTPGASDTYVTGSPKFDLATGPAGFAVIVHADRDADGTGRIRMVRSSDDGRTWSATQDVIVRPAAVFQPAVAIGADGSIGLFWYDWTSDEEGDEPLATDAWFARSTDLGASWVVTHLAGPFDLRAMHQEGLLYDGGATGAYQDLVALDDGFGAAFTVGPPLATDGRTDVWFARVAN